MKFAKRLDAVPPYLFAELERKVSEAERAGVDVISLGIGDPDLPTPRAVIEALAEAARDPRTHQYPTNHGTRGVPVRGRRLLPRPVRCRARPGRRGDPGARRARKASATSRSRASIRATSASRLIPGIRRTRPAPSSPAQPSTTCRSRGERVPARLDRRSAPEAKLLYLNYPNNPTGATAEPDFFARAVEFARERDLIVVHDNAYSEVAFDGYRAAELPRDARREGGRRRDLLALEGLEHDRLARRARRGQRGDRRALPPAEDEPRLGDVRGRAARGARSR